MDDILATTQQQHYQINLPSVDAPINNVTLEVVGNMSKKIKVMQHTELDDESYGKFEMKDFVIKTKMLNKLTNQTTLQLLNFQNNDNIQEQILNQLRTINDKLNNLETNLKKELDDKFANLETRLERKLDDKFANLETRLERKLDEKFANLETRLERKLDGKLKEIKTSIEISIFNKKIIKSNKSIITRENEIKWPKNQQGAIPDPRSHGSAIEIPKNIDEVIRIDDATANYLYDFYGFQRTNEETKAKAIKLLAFIGVSHEQYMEI